MRKISLKQTEHIASLARLELSQKEKQNFPEQISDILNYIEKLQKAKTISEPIAQITGLENIYRDDEIGKLELEKATKKELLHNIPETEGDYIKVPLILE